jgi:predicted transcriptional regulator
MEIEAWLVAHQARIEAQIAEGYAAAQRGELIDAEKVRSQLAELKRTMRFETRGPA